MFLVLEGKSAFSPYKCSHSLTFSGTLGRMSRAKKRCCNGTQVDVDKKATSSYGHLKRKLVACEDEKERLEVLVQQLQMELGQMGKTKTELASILEGTLSAGSSYQSMKKNHDSILANDIHLKNVVLKQGIEQQELKKRNEQLEQGSAACRKVIRELSENITTLSNANDVQRIELEKWHEKEREEHHVRVWKQDEERNTKRAVCRAFGWKQVTASATPVQAGTQRNAI